MPLEAATRILSSPCKPENLGSSSNRSHGAGAESTAFAHQVWRREVSQTGAGRRPIPMASKAQFSAVVSVGRSARSPEIIAALPGLPEVLLLSAEPCGLLEWKRGMLRAGRSCRGCRRRYHRCLRCACCRWCAVSPAAF